MPEAISREQLRIVQDAMRTNPEFRDEVYRRIQRDPSLAIKLRLAEPMPEPEIDPAVIAPFQLRPDEAEALRASRQMAKSESTSILQPTADLTQPIQVRPESRVSILGEAAGRVLRGETVSPPEEMGRGEAIARSFTESALGIAPVNPQYVGTQMGPHPLPSEHYPYSTTVGHLAGFGVAILPVSSATSAGIKAIGLGARAATAARAAGPVAKAVRSGVTARAVKTSLDFGLLNLAQSGVREVAGVEQTAEEVATGALESAAQGGALGLTGGLAGKVPLKGLKKEAFELAAESGAFTALGEVFSAIHGTPRTAQDRVIDAAIPLLFRIPRGISATQRVIERRVKPKMGKGADPKLMKSDVAQIVTEAIQSEPEVQAELKKVLVGDPIAQKAFERISSIGKTGELVISPEARAKLPAVEQAALREAKRYIARDYAAGKGNPAARRYAIQLADYHAGVRTDPPSEALAGRVPPQQKSRIDRRLGEFFGKIEELPAKQSMKQRQREAAQLTEEQKYLALRSKTPTEILERGKPAAPPTRQPSEAPKVSRKPIARTVGEIVPEAKPETKAGQITQRAQDRIKLATRIAIQSKGEGIETALQGLGFKNSESKEMVGFLERQGIVGAADPTGKRSVAPSATIVKALKEIGIEAPAQPAAKPTRAPGEYVDRKGWEKLKTDQTLTVGELITDPALRKNLKLDTDKSLSDTPVKVNPALKTAKAQYLGYGAETPEAHAERLKAGRSIGQIELSEGASPEQLLHEIAHAKRDLLGRPMHEELPYRERPEEQSARRIAKLAEKQSAQAIPVPAEPKGEIITEETVAKYKKHRESKGFGAVAEQGNLRIILDGEQQGFGDIPTEKKYTVFEIGKGEHDSILGGKKTNATTVSEKELREFNLPVPEAKPSVATKAEPIPAKPAEAVIETFTTPGLAQEAAKIRGSETGKEFEIKGGEGKFRVEEKQGEGEGRVVARMMSRDQIKTHPELQYRVNEANLKQMIAEGVKSTKFRPLEVVEWSGDGNLYSTNNTRMQLAEHFKMKEVPVEIIRVEDIRRDWGKYLPESKFPRTADGDWKVIRFYARINNEATKQATSLERAGAIRRMLDEGLSEDAISQIYSTRDVNKVRALSGLDPNGKFAALIDQEGTPARLVEFARWTGEIRNLFPDRFTNRHEAEVFDFFTKNKDKFPDLTKAQFAKMIESRMNDVFRAVDEPLDLKREGIITGARAYAENLEHLRTKLENINERLRTSITAEEKSALNTQKSEILKKIETAHSSQRDIFGNPEAGAIRIPTGEELRAFRDQFRDFVGGGEKFKAKTRGLYDDEYHYSIIRRNLGTITNARLLSHRMETARLEFDEATGLIVPFFKDAKGQYRRANDAEVSVVNAQAGEWQMMGVRQNAIEDVRAAIRPIHRGLLKAEYWGERGEKFIEQIEKWDGEGKDLPEPVRKAVLDVRAVLDGFRKRMIGTLREFAENPIKEIMTEQYVERTGIPKNKLKDKDRYQILLDTSKEIERLFPDNWGIENYFPHIMDGPWVIQFKHENGKYEYMGSERSRARAEGRIRELAKENKVPVSDFTRTFYESSNATIKNLSESDPALWAVISELHKNQNGEVNPLEIMRFLEGRTRQLRREQAPKFPRTMRREGYPGYVVDFNRSMQNYIGSVARWEHVNRIDRLIREPLHKLEKDGQKDLARWVRSQFEYLRHGPRNPVMAEIDNWLMKQPYGKYILPGFTHRWLSQYPKQLTISTQLRISGSYYIQQLAQYFQTVAPFIKGTPVLGKAWRNGMKLSKSQEGRDLLRKYGVGFMTIGKPLEGSARTLTSPKFREAPFGVRALRRLAPETYHVENAWCTFYKSHFDRLVKEGASAKDAERQAALIAKWQVAQTMFTPSAIDTPRFAQGPIKSLVFMFRRFQVKRMEQVYQLMRTKNIGGLGKLLITQAALGGAMSLIRPISHGSSMLPIGDDRAKPAFLAWKMYNRLRESLGPEAANLLYFGLPALANLDMSYSFSFVDMPLRKEVPLLIGEMALGPFFGNVLDIAAETGKKSGTEPSMFRRFGRAVGERTALRQPEVAATLYEGPNEEGQYTIRDADGSIRIQGDVWALTKWALRLRNTEQGIDDLFLRTLYSIESERKHERDRAALEWIGENRDESDAIVDRWNDAWGDIDPLRKRDIRRLARDRQDAANLPKTERVIKEMPKAVRRSEELQPIEAEE